MDVSSAIHLLMILLFLVSPIQTVNSLQIIFTDQTHHIEIGAEVRLTCVVIGGNKPHVTWISPKGQLPSNTMTEHNGQTLIISGFDTADIGQYICVASDGLQFANHVFTVALSSTTTLKHTTEKTSTSTKHVTTPTQQVTTSTQQVTTPTQQVKTPTQQVTTRVLATLLEKTTSERPSTSSPPTTTQTHTTSQSVETTLPNTHSPVQSTGLDCMMCNDVISPAFCTNSVKCGTHEECYLEQFLRDGRVLYMQGCMNKFACSGIQSPAAAAIIGRRRQSDGVVLCESCCSDYNGCNLGGLCNTPGVPPKILDISVSPSKIRVGDNVDVKCNALGVPKPSIQWGVMASSYPDNLRFVQGEAVLRILNFNPNNEHIYRCTAENINGTDTKNIAIRIN